MKNLFMGLLLLLSVPALAQEESAYDRVMRTGTLRCGYFIYAPVVVKDANTGAMSGLFYDYMQALGKALDIKIEWLQEANFATYLADLNAGRYDAECSGGFPNALRGKQADYSKSIAFIPTYLYVRADDTRFDNDLSAINDPAVRFAFVDGDSASLLRARRFPKTTPDALAQSVQPADTVQELINNKADVVFLDALTGDRLLRQYKNKIRQVPSAPLRVIPLNMTLPKGDVKLLSTINTGHDELMYDGVVDRILDHYDPSKSLLLRAAKPYGVQ